MLEDKNEQKNEEQSVSPQEANDFEFLKEKIKERPIDKKKLVQRLVITASMALIFGIIACLTFLLLEPVLNNWLHPEKEPDIVTFPEEEILPENMLSEENTKPQTEEQSQCEEESTDNVSFEEMIEIEQGYLEERRSGRITYCTIPTALSGSLLFISKCKEEHGTGNRCVFSDRLV